MLVHIRKLEADGVVSGWSRRANVRECVRRGARFNRDAVAGIPSNDGVVASAVWDLGAYCDGKRTSATMVCNGWRGVCSPPEVATNAKTAAVRAERENMAK